MASPGQPPLPSASPQWLLLAGKRAGAANTINGSSQWEYPTGPADATQPGATPQPTHQYPGQHQYHQQESASAQDTAQPETSRGLMSMAAGAVLGHEMHGHSHHSDHHNFMGSMATYLGSAGVGALGAKLFSGKKQPQPAYTQHANNPPSASHPPFQGYPASPPPAPFHPGQSPPPPVYTGQPMPPHPGHYAMGAGAAGGVASAMAVNAVSNYPQHHYQQQPAGPLLEAVGWAPPTVVPSSLDPV